MPDRIVPEELPRRPAEQARPRLGPDEGVIGTLFVLVHTFDEEHRASRVGAVRRGRSVGRRSVGVHVVDVEPTRLAPHLIGVVVRRRVRRHQMIRVGLTDARSERLHPRPRRGRRIAVAADRPHDVRIVAVAAPEEHTEVAQIVVRRRDDLVVPTLVGALVTQIRRHQEQGDTSLRGRIHQPIEMLEVRLVRGSERSADERGVTVGVERWIARELVLDHLGEHNVESLRLTVIEVQRCLAPVQLDHDRPRRVTVQQIGATRAVDEIAVVRGDRSRERIDRLNSRLHRGNRESTGRAGDVGRNDRPDDDSERQRCALHPDSVKFHRGLQNRGISVNLP